MTLHLALVLFFPLVRAHDALHHGRYEPEGQLPEVVVIIPVVVRRPIPMVL